MSKSIGYLLNRIDFTALMLDNSTMVTKYFDDSIILCSFGQKLISYEKTHIIIRIITCFYNQL